MFFIIEKIVGKCKIEKFNFLFAAWFCHNILSQMFSFYKILVDVIKNFAKLHKIIDSTPMY